MAAKVNIFRKIWLFYYEGFRSMTLGRTLWLIILIKLAIMFLVLKIFFFPSFLGGKDEVEKADFVSNELIHRSTSPD
ncbi:MAG: DUF4492 domain-containing protein [Rikenellaceae bacterium]